MARSANRLVASIQVHFRRTNKRAKQTGVLNPGRSAAALNRKRPKALSDRARLGKIGFDPVQPGVRPRGPADQGLRRIPTNRRDRQQNGRRPRAQIQIESWRQRDNTLSLTALADREAKAEGAARSSYRAVEGPVLRALRACRT